MDVGTMLRLPSLGAAGNAPSGGAFKAPSSGRGFLLDQNPNESVLRLESRQVTATEKVNKRGIEREKAECQACAALGLVRLSAADC